jgi:hypothetical protein
MTRPLPNVKFKIGRRQMSPKDRRWLRKKKDILSNIWVKKGPEILSGIEEQCGFGFPAKTISAGMIIHLFQRRCSDNLGDMDETKPLECNIYMGRSDTWRELKAPLVHELIHCLMWQKLYFDRRTGKPTFFADVFADELMACVVERLVIGFKPSYDACYDAIDAALGEAVYRLSETNQRGKLVKALMEFFDDYISKVGKKESNILKERENLLDRLPSLIPESITEKEGLRRCTKARKKLRVSQ